MKKLLFIFLGGLLFCLLMIIMSQLGLFSASATDTPGRIESALARRALHKAIARSAEHLKNPLAISTETLRMGMNLYRSNCAGCHGEPSKPSLWGTTDFYPRVPQLTDSPSELSDSQIFVVIKFGIRYSGMAAWKGMIPEKDMWEIATFLGNIRVIFGCH